MPYVILDEFQNTRLDETVQFRALTRRARVRRERVDEVGETVEHEHGTVPRRCRCIRSSGSGSRMSLTHRVLFLCCSDAHLYGGVDERVESTLDRRDFVIASRLSTRLPIAVIVNFCSVQRKDRAQVLGVRQKRLRGRERGIGWIERDAQKRAALCRDGVEEDRVRRCSRPGVFIPLALRQNWEGGCDVRGCETKRTP